MATEPPLQLGPMASLRKHLPARKISISRYTTKPPAGLPEFEMIKPSGMNSGVVISVTEGRPSTSESATALPRENTTTGNPAEHRPRLPPITIPAKAHITPQQRPESPPSPLTPSPPLSPPPMRAPSAADVPLPRSSTSTPTLVRTGSNATTAVQTPVMRSMFPSYNPSVPLTQQNYYPNMDVAPAPAYTRMAAGPSNYVPYSQQGNRSGSQARLGIEEQAVETKESPLRRSESLKRAAKLSTPDELVHLWSIANGQSTEEAPDSYTLELSCDDLSLDHEIITFNTSNSQPLYKLEASNNKNISISRNHPKNSTVIPICASTLFRPSRQDPLVTSIFPKLAGLMALDQSSSVAVSHHLDRQSSNVLQAEAMERAQDREGSMLLWDSDSGKYCLMHPTLLDNTATTLPLQILPTPTNPTSITIFAPETSLPLLTLSLLTLTLTLHTPTITALPSLYILDTLLTTLLTLLLHLHRSCATPHPTQEIPSFPPPPPSLHSRSSRHSLRQPRSRSRLSVFRPKSSRSLRSPTPTTEDIEMTALPPPHDSSTGIHFYDEEKGSVGQKRKAPKPMFSYEDPALPTGTRAVLRFLHWGVEVLYWILGVLVQVLAGVVVGLGKLIVKL